MPQLPLDIYQGIAWPLTGGYTLLTGGARGALPLACSGDGTTIYGAVFDVDYNTTYAKWNATTGVRTAIAPVPTSLFQIYYMYADYTGDVVVGWDIDGAKLWMWTDGGATITLLPFAAVDDHNVQATGLLQGVVIRFITDDGAKTFGTIEKSDYTDYVASWNPAGVVTRIADGEVGYVSADGSVFSGRSPTATLSYYKASAWHDLRFTVDDFPGADFISFAYFVASNNTMILGRKANNNYGWWDISSVEQGVWSDVDLPSTQVQLLNGAADTVAVAVGWCGSIGVANTPIKVTGTTFVILPVRPSSEGCIALNCSADGTRVVGNDSTDVARVPTWWDASNVRHELPVPGAPYSLPEASDIARSGATAWGRVTETIMVDEIGFPTTAWAPGFSAIFYPQPGKRRR